MSEIVFSNEQLSAIEKRNSSLLVSAAAGAGKTAVLVERIIRKITEQNVNINELLVVTFTNAAANGMKEKIRKAIKECIKKNKSNSFLKRQLYLIDSANICTVHSFCLGLIKKYSYMLPENIPSKFTLLEETERALIMQQLANEIINEYYEKNDEIFETLSESYSGIRSDDMLVELILSIYSFIVSIPDYSCWVKDSIKALTDEEDFYNSSCAKSLYRHIKSVLKAALEKYRFALSFMEGDELLAPYYDLFKEEETEIKRALSTDNLYDLIKSIGKIEFDSLNSHRPKKGAETEIPKKTRETVKKAINELKELYSNEIISIDINNKENLDIILKLFEIVLLFDERFKAEKYEKGTLDFNDLEHLTIELISENGTLKEEFYPLRESFNEIMVDEYQDTNDVQESIFNLIKKENNLFTVGDVKQSIYRFRHANPNLFIERIKEYTDRNDAEVISLNANYRCHKNIVDTINFIFSFIMTEDISKIDYEKTEKLISKGEFKDTSSEKLSCELKIALCESDNEETLQSIEAKMLASAIKNMVRDNEFLIEGRNLTYKDIVILVRSFNEKTLDFLSCLKGEGIPCIYEDKTAFFETAEIKSVIALLKVIDNPYDDISLIAALRNVFDYSDDELLTIRLNDKKAPFYEAFNLSEREKDKKLISYLKELKKYSLMYEINPLIEKIYEDTFFIEKQLGLINGYKRSENLKRLSEIARDYENTEFKGISSFITYVNKIITGKKKLSNPKLNDDSDAVRIMSIHKSKGLEFPVVILAGMHKKFNRMDLNDNIILNSSLGIGYNVVNTKKQYKYQSVYKNILKEDEKRELISEEMRVLYVALTRAKYKLIMSGALNKKDDWYLKYTNTLLSSENKISYIDFMNLGSYFDMVIPPLLKHRAFVNVAGNKWIKDCDFNFNLSLFDEEKSKETEENELKKIVLPEDITLKKEEKEDFDKRVGYRYDNPLSKVPKKISVSALREEFYGDETSKSGARTEIYVPDFRKESKITAAERGTLIHYIFEKINLKSLRKSDDKLSVILEFIDNNEYIKERLTLSDLKKVENFFNHPLGIKMLRAKEVWREKDFLMRMNVNEIYSELKDLSCDDKIIIQGIMDCYFVDTKGEIYLIDYKYLKKSEKQIRDTYSYQIELYKEALSKQRRVKKNDIKAFIWDVNKGNAIEF